MIYFTSDLHLFHDKEFIFKARGYASIEEHDRSIIANINSLVGEDDQLYILGDLALMCSGEDIERAYSKIKCPNIHFIRGNHDSNQRVQKYAELGFIDEGYAKLLDLEGYHFMISHYPMITNNYDDGKNPHLRVFNLCGHTHTKDQFELAEHGAFNVGVDAHDGFPISVDSIIDAINRVMV